MKNKLLNSVLALTSIFLITGCGEEEIDTSKLSSSTDNSNITSNVQSNTVSNTVSNKPVTSNKTTTTSNKTTTTTKPTTTSNKTTTTASNTKTLTCTKYSTLPNGMKLAEVSYSTFVNKTLTYMKFTNTYTAPANKYISPEGRTALLNQFNASKKQYASNNIKFSYSYNSNYTKYVVVGTFDIKKMTQAEMQKLGQQNVYYSKDYTVNKNSMVQNGYSCK